MKFFFKTITETFNALNNKTHLGEKNDKFITRTQAIARIIITLFLLPLSYYLINSNDEKLRDQGFLLIGTITGYWLR